MAECDPDFAGELGTAAIGIFASDRPTGGFQPSALDASARAVYDRFAAAWQARPAPSSSAAGSGGYGRHVRSAATATPYGTPGPSASDGYEISGPIEEGSANAGPTEEGLSGFAAGWALVHDVLPVAARTGQRLDPTTIAAAARSVDLPIGSLPNGAGLHFSADPATLGQNERAAAVIWQWQAVRSYTFVWPGTYQTGQIAFVPLVPMTTLSAARPVAGPAAGPAFGAVPMVLGLALLVALRWALLDGMPRATPSLVGASLRRWVSRALALAGGWRLSRPARLPGRVPGHRTLGGAVLVAIALLTRPVPHLWLPAAPFAPWVADHDPRRDRRGGRPPRRPLHPPRRAPGLAAGPGGHDGHLRACPRAALRLAGCAARPRRRPLARGPPPRDRRGHGAGRRPRPRGPRHVVALMDRLAMPRACAVRRRSHSSRACSSSPALGSRRRAHRRCTTASCRSSRTCGSIRRRVTPEVPRARPPTSRMSVARTTSSRSRRPSSSPRPRSSPRRARS